MNPHGMMDRLTQCPARPACEGTARPNATASCDPRTSSGTTIRASGPAWCSQAGARSLTPTVAITRSYGAPGG